MYASTPTRWLLGVALLFAVSFSSRSVAQQSEVRVDGLVVEHQKYSFTLRGLDRDYRIIVPNGTPLYMKLTMPEIDFDKRLLSVELLVSAPDGDYRNNTRLGRPIPDPLFLSAEFSDTASRANVLSKEGIRRLDSFVLSGRPAAPDELAIQGRLMPGRQPGQYRLENEAQVMPVELGPRRGLLAHASVVDLRPNETEVIVEGNFEADALVASRIRFQPVGDPFARFRPGLPNVLVIGDQTSLNYDRALRETLAGRVNVHHPPANCGGSENWRMLHHWLANPDGGSRRWDVIAFNFGLHDETTSQSILTENIRRSIEILQATGAQLIWITTTPIPRGFPEPRRGSQPLGLVEGRMKLQNDWVAPLLREFPEIHVCDLWQVVADDSDGIFRKWWEGNSLAFDYPASRPLGAAVADCIIQAVSSR